MDIAKNLGVENLFCLIAADDEAFTHNHKVSQVMSIQEHFMIRQAVKCPFALCTWYRGEVH